ncbi:hypothetical protein TYRP_007830 [Tyrophagus putrescentiae]|nr:hypothetical protein TYRP_007830 [Tyrophagus putrescentiae]
MFTKPGRAFSSTVLLVAVPCGFRVELLLLPRLQLLSRRKVRGRRCQGHQLPGARILNVGDGRGGGGGLSAQERPLPLPRLSQLHAHRSRVEHSRGGGIGRNERSSSSASACCPGPRILLLPLVDIVLRWHLHPLLLGGPHHRVVFRAPVYPGKRSFCRAGSAFRPGFVTSECVRRRLAASACRRRRFITDR